jgi:hypothetical protein
VSIDLILFIAAGILPLVMAALGGHLATNKLGYRIAFWSLGFITSIAVVIVGIRTEHAQSVLQAQLNKIQKNTETPPQVVVNVPPSAPPQITINPPSVASGFMQLYRTIIVNPELRAGERISVNIFIRNEGAQPVYSVYRNYFIALSGLSGDPAKVDAHLHARFLKDSLKAKREYAKTNKGLTVGVKETLWNSLETDPLTQEQVDGIKQGAIRLYAYAWAGWQGARHDLDACRWFQLDGVTKIDNKELVTHDCSF